MRSSAANSMDVRPTVRFYYIVRGGKDNHGKEFVTQVDVRTSRRDAEVVHRDAVVMPGDWVRLFEVKGRTSYGKPEFNSRLLKSRVEPAN